MANAQDPPALQDSEPRLITFGRLLLTVQACLWAIVVLPAATIAALSLRPNVVNHTALHAAAFVSISIVALLFMVGMSAASAYLAANLKSGRTNIRRAAIALEAFMACFGLLIADAAASTGAGIIAGLPVSAGLVGTMLSVSAAAGLLGKAARNFTRPVRSA